MKSIIKYSKLLPIVLGLAACHKIEVPVTTQLTPDVFPQTPAQFVQASGPAYVALRGNYGTDYCFMTSLTTDESILPARGGNWYDNQGYRMMHYHDWTRDHGGTNTIWNWLSKAISATNQSLSILDKTMPAGASKTAIFAELKTVRAIDYFMLMDMYGNVPLDTVYGDFAPRTNLPRTQVFAWLEGELKAAIPNLLYPSAATYGRADRYTAWALLAKMYLNAEYYTGTARWNDCIAACDTIINSGKYSLATRTNYLQMFYPNNGPGNTPEFIFTIPYDPSMTSAYGLNGFMYHARYDVPRSEQAKFNLPFTPSAPRSTLPEFYANFNDPNDIRNNQWLTGLQFLNNGTTPVTVTTTKKGYDQFYTGADGGAALTYQVNLTPNIVLRQDSVLFDCGNDEIAWNMGYRNIKFYPDATSTNRNQSNDQPFLRYADVLLMKAEAILRGGTPTGGQTALSLVNQVRANRTTSAALTTVDLNFLYAERCREMAMENWHRNDMIRFGRYEGSWGFKRNADTYRRIFPIPTGAIVLNPALKQNPGY
jgi:starch-binding outer membrane protein, SusD/RagB family